MNKHEIIAKVMNFLDKYEAIEAEMNSNDSGKTSFYESLDENYDLVVIKAPVVGEVVAITDKSWTPIFYYMEDEDEFTIGDLICGYLDLYFKR